MDKKELIEKITQKKEFSQLPKKDVELAFSNFDKENYIDKEKIKLTRDLLRKVFSVFTSEKLLKIKDKDKEWFLKKHFSTKERLPFYKEVYKRLLKDSKKPLVLDLGAGINGFSFDYLKQTNKKTKYIAIEAIGQLVSLMDYYFKKNNLNAKAIQKSLFELEEIKKIIKKEKGEKIVLLLKTLDSLEMLKRNYSKKLLSEITPLVDKVVISFATKSLISKKTFKVKRNWLLNFIKENFYILDEFEQGNEKYIVFQNKNN